MHHAKDSLVYFDVDVVLVRPGSDLRVAQLKLEVGVVAVVGSFVQHFLWTKNENPITFFSPFLLYLLASLRPCFKTLLLAGTCHY